MKAEIFQWFLKSDKYIKYQILNIFVHVILDFNLILQPCNWFHWWLVLLKIHMYVACLIKSADI